MTSNKFIHQFLIEFFKAEACQVDESSAGVLSIDLTAEMDKALMNRPFYWQYMTSTGQVGQPMQLRLITDTAIQEDKGEWIHFGTPRLEQIERFLRNKAFCTMLYEVKKVDQKTMLQPWIITNYCIKYEGKQKKEELFSLGLNLINGVMVFNMMEQLADVPLAPVISDHCYTISPLITLQSGYRRIEAYIDDYIEKQPHDWADKSQRLLDEELKMIEYFYQDDANEAEKEKAISDVTKRLAPAITHQVINGGLFYLSQSFLTKPS